MCNHCLYLPKGTIGQRSDTSPVEKRKYTWQDQNPEKKGQRSGSVADTWQGTWAKTNTKEMSVLTVNASHRCRPPQEKATGGGPGVCRQYSCSGTFLSTPTWYSLNVNGMPRQQMPRQQMPHQRMTCQRMTWHHSWHADVACTKVGLDCLGVESVCVHVRKRGCILKQRGRSVCCMRRSDV